MLPLKSVGRPLPNAGGALSVDGFRAPPIPSIVAVTKGHPDPFDSPVNIGHLTVLVRTTISGGQTHRADLDDLDDPQPSGIRIAAVQYGLIKFFHRRCIRSCIVLRRRRCRGRCGTSRRLFSSPTSPLLKSSRLPAQCICQRQRTTPARIRPTASQAIFPANPRVREARPARCYGTMMCTVDR